MSAEQSGEYYFAPSEAAQKLRASLQSYARSAITQFPSKEIDNATLVQRVQLESSASKQLEALQGSEVHEEDLKSFTIGGVNYPNGASVEGKTTTVWGIVGGKVVVLTDRVIDADRFQKERTIVIGDQSEIGRIAVPSGNMRYIPQYGIEVTNLAGTVRDETDNQALTSTLSRYTARIANQFAEQLLAAAPADPNTTMPVMLAVSSHK